MARPKLPENVDAILGRLRQRVVDLENELSEAKFILASAEHAAKPLTSKKIEALKNLHEK
jgi:hypothetical protein